MNITDKELRTLLAKTLASIWRRVSWKDMGTSVTRQSDDIFAARLRASAGMETFPQMFDKVCTGLGLPSAKIDTIDSDILDDELPRVRVMMRREAIVISSLTKKEAAIQVEAAKKLKGNSSLEGF